MIQGFDITNAEWSLTPQSVRLAAVSLQHQLYTIKARFNYYEKQLSANQTRIERLERVNQIKILEIEQLQLENLKLKERLRQNSSNSSFPPSSDLPSQKQLKVLGSGGKQGGQPGHHGVSRKLISPDQINQVIELRGESCSRCGALLLGNDSAPARRQVVEIKDGRALVTEYRQHRIKCLGCSQINRENWPAETSRGSFGQKTHAIVAYLTGRLSLSHRDVVEALKSLFDLKIGLGSIAAIQKRISQALAEPVAQAVKYVKRQASQCVDETGWFEKSRNNWLWVNSTDKVTVFQIRQGRSREDAQEIIDIDEMGIVTTDRYPGYNFLQPWRRQICWAHLRRDFTAISQRDDEESKAIGAALLIQTRILFDLCQMARDGTIDHFYLKSEIESLKVFVRRDLEKGTQIENQKTALTCRNILKNFRSLWTFNRISEVEPTNNRAERALRRAVLWRKKSFGTQSEAGSRFVERILTVVTTLKQQGRTVLDFLICTIQNLSDAVVGNRLTA